MKKIILLLLFVQPIFSQRIAINKIDEFTDIKVLKIDASEGKTWKGTDNIAKGLFNYIFLSNRYNFGKEESLYTTLQITIGADFCVSPDSGKVIFLLDDETKITLNQISKIDCKQQQLDVSYSIENIENQLEYVKILAAKKINKIRFYTTKGFVDFDIKENKKEIIKNTFNLFLIEINKIRSKSTQN
jgi:hypothetical protein